MHFWTDESGAVTVDWVVLTASIIGLGAATMASVGSGTMDLADLVNSDLGGTSVASYLSEQDIAAGNLKSAQAFIDAKAAYDLDPTDGPLAVTALAARQLLKRNISDADMANLIKPEDIAWAAMFDAVYRTNVAGDALRVASAAYDADPTAALLAVKNAAADDMVAANLQYDAAETALFNEFGTGF
jgi:hypothetical protein